MFLAGLFISTLAVRIGIELSIDGGIQTVVLNGGPIDAPGAGPVVEAFRLDQPVLLRHVDWFVDVFRGELGRSIRNRVPVQDLVTPRLPITAQIAATSLVVSVLAGTFFGIVGALRDVRSKGQFISTGVGFFQAMPVFILTLLLPWLFAFQLGVLPSFGWVRPSVSLQGNVETLILPVLTLSLPEGALIARLVKTGMHRVLGEDYILAAQAKGLPRWRVLTRHALRPASFTVVTEIGLILGSLFAGSVIVERMFAIGGMGVVFFEASIGRDLHVLLFVTMLLTGLIMTIRIITDVIYRWLDPRIDNV